MICDYKRGFVPKKRTVGWTAFVIDFLSEAGVRVLKGSVLGFLPGAVVRETFQNMFKFTLSTSP